MQDLKKLYSDGNYELCYEELLRSNTLDQTELSLIYSCEKKLKKHQFNKWNFAQYIKNISYKEVLNLFENHYISLKIDNKIEILLKLKSMGCIQEVQDSVEVDFLYYIKNKKHGCIEKTLNNFLDEVNKSNSLIIKLLIYLIGIGDDKRGLELVTSLCVEIESIKYKTNIINSINAKELIDTIDNIYEIESREYLNKLQLLRFLLSLKFNVETKKEIYLRTSLFWIENDKYWKKFNRKNIRIAPVNVPSDRTVIMTLEEDVIIKNEDIFFEKECFVYHSEREEEEIILRLKHNDPILDDNVEKLLKSFVEFKYYNAVIELSKKYIKFEYECIYAFWESRQYTRLIEYYEALGVELREKVEYKYYAAKAWHALGKTQLAKKYYKDIMIKDRLFRDVEVYWKNVQGK